MRYGRDGRGQLLQDLGILDKVNTVFVKWMENEQKYETEFKLHTNDTRQNT